MSITATQVNDLRKRTGISMMACKKALMEADGNEEKAIELLRKRGEAKAAEKSTRETSEGLIITKSEGGKGVIVKLLCETDFVAKNEEFVAIVNTAADTAIAESADAAKAQAEPVIKELFTKLGENMSIEIKTLEGEGVCGYVHTNGKVGTLIALQSADEEKARDVAMHVTAMNPPVIRSEEVSDELVAKEKEIWIEQLKNEGKPDVMIEKILMGKESKFRAESALLKQPFVKDPSATVQAYLGDNTVLAFERMAI